MKEIVKCFFIGCAIRIFIMFLMFLINLVELGSIHIILWILLVWFYGTLDLLKFVLELAIVVIGGSAVLYCFVKYLLCKAYRLYAKLCN